MCCCFVVFYEGGQVGDGVAGSREFSDLVWSRSGRPWRFPTARTQPQLQRHSSPCSSHLRCLSWFTDKSMILSEKKEEDVANKPSLHIFTPNSGFIPRKQQNFYVGMKMKWQMTRWPLGGTLGRSEADSCRRWGKDPIKALLLSWATKNSSVL